MRILIASKRAPNRPGRRNGGVQTWIQTVAAELKRRGHSVSVADAVIPASGQFDLGIFANARYTRQFWPLCERSILISHGIVADERPEPGCTETRFTSEEVREHWRGSGAIIRQPINLDYWSDIRAKRFGLVRYSARAGMDWLGAARLSGVTHNEAREVLRRAQCVYATGRAAVEAAACGAPVVILDNRAYQGELIAEFGRDQMRRNYSGRGGCQPTPAKVIELTDKAVARGSQRGYVEWFHDVRNVVGELL